MRFDVGFCVGTLAVALTATANDATPAQGWGMGAIGMQATDWRVTTHGTETGAMVALFTSGVFARTWASGIGSQLFAIGAGEGGFQAEYLNRFAYGVRFWRFGPAALVLRGGLEFDILSTPHGGNFELGPMLDLGYQSVTHSGYFDLSMQTVIPIIPALFSENSSRHAAEWFSVGPHMSAGGEVLLVDGSVARTMYDGELRTEFNLAVCGATNMVLCARLHNFRYDDSRKPVTMLALFVGIGGAGPSKSK
jgi:hypothetical protein